MSNQANRNVSPLIGCSFLSSGIAWSGGAYLPTPLPCWQASCDAVYFQSPCRVQRRFKLRQDACNPAPLPCRPDKYRAFDEQNRGHHQEENPQADGEADDGPLEHEEDVSHTVLHCPF